MRSLQPAHLLGLTALVGLAIPSVASAGELSARIVPPTVSVGQSARLEVSVGQSAQSNGAAMPPSVPDVDGLRIARVGQSTRMSIVNGVTSASTAYVYRVTPTRAGSFQIAGIRQGNAVADPVTLTVTNGPPATAGQSTAAPAPVAPAPAARSGGKLAFIRLSLPDKRLYAGQSVPVVVRGYFRGGTGVTLNGPPTIDTDAFTISGLDANPSQTHTVINGQNYLAVTWRGLLTAVKPGSHDLSVTLPATIQYQDAAPRPPMMNLRKQRQDLFDKLFQDDPFGDDPFAGGDPFADLRNQMMNGSLFDDPDFEQAFGRVVTRDMTLTTRDEQTRVVPLPAAGRPANFTGAVGNFDVKASLDRTDLTAGEPATLDVTVSGSGNFSQVTAPAIGDQAQWKAYAPKVTFDASDKAGFTGDKTFEQSVVAQRGGDLQFPPVSFSYFDPDAGRYVTKTTAAIPTQVAAAADTSGDNAGAILDLHDTPATTAPRLRAEAGRLIPTLSDGGIPGWLRPTALGLVLLGLLTALLLRLQRSAAADQRRRLRSIRQTARDAERQMKHAAAHHDAETFFRCARRAVQYELGAAWQVTPESITEAELVQRWPSAPGDLREVFRLADQTEYFHRAPANVDLAQWSARLDGQLRGLPAALRSAPATPMEAQP